MLHLSLCVRLSPSRRHTFSLFFYLSLIHNVAFLSHSLSRYLSRSLSHTLSLSLSLSFSRLSLSSLSLPLSQHTHTTNTVDGGRTTRRKTMDQLKRQLSHRHLIHHTSHRHLIQSFANKTIVYGLSAFLCACTVFLKDLGNWAPTLDYRVHPVTVSLSPRSCTSFN